MSVRFQISVFVFMMAQSILFGIGIVIVLATPLTAFAMQLIPWVIGLSAAIAAPVSWMIAPRLRARFWNRPALLVPTTRPSTPVVRSGTIG
jgi:hypothetical protein